ncbi:Peptidase M20/M25/M40 family protein [Zea mays]|uniref:Peptidase M20/M25/M40 family protein n=1 Tax=Zea mays TaxID=4577 RepID=A0A1D6EGL4_MAIZE|nr:Peptidase M20/M25/M40 family protein [Zea mays]
MAATATLQVTSRGSTFLSLPPPIASPVYLSSPPTSTVAARHHLRVLSRLYLLLQRRSTLPVWAIFVALVDHVTAVADSNSTRKYFATTVMDFQQRFALESVAGISRDAPTHHPFHAPARKAFNHTSSCHLFCTLNRRCLVLDNFGKPAIIAPDSINPWWSLLEEAVKSAGNKLGKLEIFPASTNSCYFRQIRLPAFGFSSMTNTPILLHETMTIMWFVSLVLVWPSDAIKFLSKNEYLKGIGIYEPIIYRSNLLILKVGKSSYANEKGKMKWNSNFGGRTSVKT